MYYKSEVRKAGNIVARIVADSISSVNNKRIVTFELEYPRFIHSEMMTHRLFSRNAASSRAIPIKTMFELVRTSPATPVHWGKNQAGMQAKEECTNLVKVSYYDGLDDPSDSCYIRYYDEVSAKDAWKHTMEEVSYLAEAFSNAGYHKQIVNRIVEPFQMIKVVLTATEYDNFLHLRNDEEAQPEIEVLAECMEEAFLNSEPEVLNPGDWHTPYYGDGFWKKSCEHTLEHALKVSSSCCAQVSYRKNDDSIEKAIDIYNKMVNARRIHASPFEHQATPMIEPENTNNKEWEDGVTHADRLGRFWSGNFKSWVQHRQLIDGHTCWDYFGEDH